MKPHKIEVNLDGRSYPIMIEEGMLRSGKAVSILTELAGNSSVCIVTHPILARLYAHELAEGLRREGVSVHLVTFPSGERYKRLSTVYRLYTRFVEAEMDRSSVVVALGGGVAGDLAGFAAATYLRGIRLVQIPTTLLAQVDASIGGKTGVDLPVGKNLAGAFHQPAAVLIDPSVLMTLPIRELRAGLAEIIKYGIICDKQFFSEIASTVPYMLQKELNPLTEAIIRSCEIKADVVSRDEQDRNLRAILNFGHTIGHALEAATNYRRYLHGEAVAIGMVSAAMIGEELGITSDNVTMNIRDVLEKASLPTVFPEDVSIEAILQAVRLDKKSQGGIVRFILASSIGEVIISESVSQEDIRSALNRQSG